MNSGVVPVEVSGEEKSNVLTQSLGGTEHEAGLGENLCHQLNQLVRVGLPLLGNNDW